MLESDSTPLVRRDSDPLIRIDSTPKRASTPLLRRPSDPLIRLDSTPLSRKESNLSESTCAARALSQLLNYSEELVPLKPVFTSADLEIFSSTKSLTFEALILFASLLNRKWPAFHRCEDVEICNELISSKLVFPGSDLSSTLRNLPLCDSALPIPITQIPLLDIFLTSLNLEELRCLATTCCLPGAVSENKSTILDSLKSALGKQRLITGGVMDLNRLRVNSERFANGRGLIILTDAAVHAFSALAFAIDPHADDAWKSRNAQTLVLSYAKRFAFPKLVIHSHSEFCSRADLEFCRCLSFLSTLIESDDDAALTIAEDAETLLTSQLTTELPGLIELPPWKQQQHMLRRLASVVWKSVKMLEKRKDYRKALDRVLVLIHHPEIGTESRRVKWLVRALVNCGHENDSATAANVKHLAATMKLTQPGMVEVAKHYQRFEGKSVPKAMHAIVVVEESVEIAGANKRDMGWVERVAFEHKYKDEWPCYLHCEGSVIMRLFGLCMYDALYRPDCWVFQSPVQQTPSNLGSEDDWGAVGSQHIMNELIKIACMDSLAIEMYVLTKLGSIGNQRIIGYGTEHDSNIPVIARCIGPNVLSCCFELIVSNCYYWSGGLPDLLLWDPVNSKAKFSEVKGPGDSLSARQAWWLRTLSSAGADACVLYVSDVPKPKSVVKRKRPS